MKSKLIIITLSVLAFTFFNCNKDKKRIEKSIDNGGPDVSEAFYIQFQANGSTWYTFENANPDISGSGADYIYNTWVQNGDNAIIKIQENHDLTSSNIEDLKGKSYQVGGSPNDPVKADIRIFLVDDGDYNTWDAVQTISNLKIDDVMDDGDFNGEKSFIVKGHFNCNVLDVAKNKQMQLSNGVFSLRFTSP